MGNNNIFFATGIGSLPFQDKKEAVNFILENFKGHMPFWPQLPKLSFFENMHVQFCEGFPGVSIDLDKKNIYVDTKDPDFIEEFEECYNAINNNDLDFFSISPEYSAGFYEFTNQIANKKFNFIKGQVIGPISYGMALLDDKAKPLLFNAELNEIIPQFLSLKAKWQISQFKKITNANIVMFIDEPYLVAIGTNQFASFNKQSIISKINTLVSAIHNEGALAGIHCCGNTDWTICFDANIDILSFDAFEFLDSLFIYKDSLNKFINRGGILSFGIVPNKEDYNLDGYLNKALEVLKKNSLLLKHGVLITSSCGCGTVSIDFAKKANRLAVEIAQKACDV